MLLVDALNTIIDDGIEAARGDYTEPRNKPKLDGSIAGFEACRGKSPDQIVLLMQEADATTRQKMMEQAPDYWYWRCYQLEVEWVANVLSAILDAQGLPIISNVTARGMMKAAEIIGVKA